MSAWRRHIEQPGALGWGLPHFGSDRIGRMTQTDAPRHAMVAAHRDPHPERVNRRRVLSAALRFTVGRTLDLMAAYFIGLASGED